MATIRLAQRGHDEIKMETPDTTMMLIENFKEGFAFRLNSVLFTVFMENKDTFEIRRGSKVLIKYRCPEKGGEADGS
jgi:hypothetical protein